MIVNEAVGQTVNVHRNLTWNGGKGFSVLDQSQVLIDRFMYVVLQDATFVIQPAGKQRAVTNQQRNVHAMVRGTLLESSMRVPSYFNTTYYTAVSYNPLDPDCTAFFTTDDMQDIYWADKVWFAHGKAWVV